MWKNAQNDPEGAFRVGVPRVVASSTYPIGYGALAAFYGMPKRPDLPHF
jgi:hypothetical protein